MTAEAVVDSDAIRIQRAASRRRSREDMVFHRLTHFSALAILMLLGGIIVSLAIGAWPALSTFGVTFFVTQAWNPVTDTFGGFASIYGTVITSLFAIVIARFVGVRIAVFLTEICPFRFRVPIGTAIELLAAIPSVVYGMWGMFVFAPFMQYTVQPFLIGTLGEVPIVSALFAGPPYGVGVLTAGLVLAIMVLPSVTALSVSVLNAVPRELRDAGYALGLTRVEVVQGLVLPSARAGIFGATMLGLGRALGETMAVTFVIGNAHRISASLLAPGTSISATIANEFTEAVGDLYLSSLILLGLALFAITFLALAAAQYLLKRGSMARDIAHPRLGAIQACMSSLWLCVIRVVGNRVNTLVARHRRSTRFSIVCTAMTSIGLVMLGIILSYLVWQGASGLSADVFLKSTPPPEGEGGLLNAVVGTLLMTGIAMPVATIVGIMAGTYMTYYGRARNLTPIVQGVNDILLSAPSIVIGLFVYEIIVVTLGHFSAIAGAVALAIIALPVVVSTTVENLRMVPDSLRDAGLALGATPSYVIWHIIYRAARPGLVTGVLLAVARVSGETAPLLFTALGNQFFSLDVNAPMASLPTIIYQFALSPYANWQQLAWTGALFITAQVLMLFIAARVIARQRQ